MARTRRDLLERDLIDFPEERGDILLEIAHKYLGEGDSDSAIKIWQELIAAGGDDEDYARTALAEWLFDAGDDAAARSELAVVKGSRRTDSGAWSLAAELFEEREELPDAHEWLTMATTRLSPADLETPAGEFGWSTWPGMLIPSRRRVRTAMGLPLDDTDRLLPADETLERMAERLEQRTSDPNTARLLFWPRSEYANVQRRWPSGRAVSWPPGRNQPCWCGSGTKYKRCCDRPSA